MSQLPMKGYVSIVSIDKPVRSQYITNEQYQNAMRQYRQLMQEQRNRNKAFGTGEVGGGRVRHAPVHGTTYPEGKPVTASFGKDGTSKEDSILLKNDHAETMEDFYGSEGNKQHDDYDGRGGGTQRGKYTGYGS